jgi:VanZ family protein
MPGVVRLWGPVALWAAAIFTASTRSDTGIVGRIPDWLTHGIAYAILSLLLARALAGGFGAALSSRAAVLAISLATLYGISDEFHQSFVPNRDASPADVAKDLLGALAGVVARYSFRRGRSSDSAVPSPYVGRDRVGGR